MKNKNQEVMQNSSNLTVESITKESIYTTRGTEEELGTGSETNDKQIPADIKSIIQAD